MKPNPNISSAEWEVMTVVWSKPPAAASDIVEQLEARRGWRSRTIRTLLDRLVKKGALRFELEGKRYLVLAARDDGVLRAQREQELSRAGVWRRAGLDADALGENDEAVASSGISGAQAHSFGKRRNELCKSRCSFRWLAG